MAERTHSVALTDGHLFGAVGGGASGFKDAEPRFGSLTARFECLGSVDVDEAACREFTRRIGVKATCRDLFSLEQFRAFHGREPPAGWVEAGPADIQAAMQHRTPDVGFLSAPCKGFSGLLPESTSLTDKYQALNALTLRGVWLWLEAFKDDPSPLIFFENVPRILTRGRHFLDQIVGLYQTYGYAVAVTTHDCGELGGLAQSRKRCLIVARHKEKVPPFMYEPPKRRLLGVGEVLDRMPLPGDPRAGVMHRMPALQWKTWVRLAFVEAGSDWRSLNKLNVENGVLADYGIMPETGWHNGVLGVNRWEDEAGVIQAQSRVMNGNFAVADPRVDTKGYDAAQYGLRRYEDTLGALINLKSPGQGAYSIADPRVDGHPKSVQLGVRRWGQTAATVKGDMSVGTGPYAVSDPRLQGPPRFNNTFRIVRYGESAPAVHGPGGAGGGLAVADPRPPEREDYKQTKYRVTHMREAAGAVIGASSTGNGAYAVADPRTPWGPNTHQNKLHVTPYGNEAKAIQASQQVASGALSVADPRPACLNKDGREGYSSQAHYGVVPWAGTANAVPAFAKNNNGPWSVADPRGGLVIDEPEILLPRPEDRLVCVIISMDGTHHRPFTTMELAALQSYIEPEEAFSFSFEGKSDSQHREWIGNMVPRAAAKAMAEVAGRTLLMSMSGETYVLSNDPIWVRPERSLEIALSIDAPELPA